MISNVPNELDADDLEGAFGSGFKVKSCKKKRKGVFVIVYGNVKMAREAIDNWGQQQDLLWRQNEGARRCHRGVTRSCRGVTQRCHQGLTRGVSETS